MKGPQRPPAYAVGGRIGSLEVLDVGDATKTVTKRIVTVRCVVCGYEDQRPEKNLIITGKRDASYCWHCSSRRHVTELEDAIRFAVAVGCRTRGEIASVLAPQHKRSATWLSTLLSSMVRRGLLARERITATSSRYTVPGVP